MLKPERIKEIEETCKAYIEGHAGCQLQEVAKCIEDLLIEKTILILPAFKEVAADFILSISLPTG